MDFPSIGTIGLTQIAGNVGKGIKFGEWLNGEGFHEWEHAFVLLPGQQILEAEPGKQGALIRSYHYGDDVYWCTNIRKLLGPSLADPVVQATADRLKGTPYSFVDYLALSMHRLRIPAPGLKHFIETSKHEICSQLADDFYYRLRTQIFDDGRWPGYVTPASLYNRDIELAR